MAILTREKLKFLDKVFYAQAALEKAAEDAARQALMDAANSADPTARTALVKVAGVKPDKAAAWVDVILETWTHAADELDMMRAMDCRYLRKWSAEHTCIVLHISKGTYYNCRKEFLTAAYFIAVQRRLM